MISRILNARATYRNALDYNEKKVAEGNASIVGYRNLPDDDILTLYRTFEALEQNPRVKRNVREKGFHMAVSPEPGEAIYGDEERTVELVGRLMDDLGYGGQPYVIYKHNDIEREHFHVVSSRIRKDGTTVSSSYEGLGLLTSLRRMEKEFGYVTGRSEEKSEELRYRNVAPEDSDKIARMHDCVDLALKYDFSSFVQFQAILLMMGIRAAKAERKGREVLLFSVVDKNTGTVMSSVVSESVLRLKARDRFEKKVRQAWRAGLPLKEEKKLEVVVVYCSGKAKTWREFGKMLDECGIGFVMDEKAGRCIGYSLVDRNFRNVVKPSELAEDCSPARLNALGWPLGEPVKEEMLDEDDKEEIRLRIVSELKKVNADVVDRRAEKEKEGLGIGTTGGGRR